MAASSAPTLITAPLSPSPPTSRHSSPGGRRRSVSDGLTEHFFYCFG